ncbi:methylated-DNA-[protein]-cysteine S-methyltransferase/AraC family transcriptional regulator, regulatory protein of adaptative response / DNA-3-methyladenine glycosylase II [Streptomyces sp. 3213]|uniref:DNA-3-methyladenine glycosylase 2 family protein n=1 Tax=Streptomyces sp. 3213.3 TaxID=1855348 RepID=UPI000899AC86|nr:DNA-3-methyladenine glycosylase 2 family protein [Streptomyces sp. 3213.3]SEE69882.1 methylated-DNA-[protein]-cysteine S-methyltransferase/AraC family transcriptional regulator, regulatory protein of adaptative response / DNA-3-methyladenine glycosylase II [Streptomyces sp. 3213] [Streptomyces sp. 3213.3]
MDEDSRYEAVRSRDARFDGEFFFGVATTGIYCRPSCPAVTPKRRNVRFFMTAAAAQGSGFRACRRCRPDAVPGSAEWNVRADVVGRAMRLIGDGVVDREGVAGLAVRLGYSARQVQRQLTAELGAGPVALARAQRAHTARVLVQTTDLPITEIAFASGFASVRQFNDTIRAVYASTPSELRTNAPQPPARAQAKEPDSTPTDGADPAAEPSAGIPLRLAHRGPYQSAAVFDLLQREAVPGIEEVTGTPGRRTYRRTLGLPYGTGIVAVDERPGTLKGRPHTGGWLDARLHLTDHRDLTTAVQRLRRLLDLDADPYAVDERLGADPRLGPLVAARPGLRSPGAADPEELAVRALVGRAESERLVRCYGRTLDAPSGSLTHLFPEPSVLAEALPGDPSAGLVTALADGTVRLDVGADRDDAQAALLALPGMDAATVAVIRARALGDPDVAPPGADIPDAWRPWRSYAVQHLLAAGELELP